MRSWNTIPFISFIPNFRRFAAPDGVFLPLIFYPLHSDPENELIFKF